MNLESLHLKLFAREHADTIASWPLDAEEAKAWAGHKTTYPVSSGQMLEWHRDARSFVGIMHEELIAYGELWVSEDLGDVELARLIVKPELRGQGVGRAFVQALVDECMRRDFDEIFLRVVPGNQAAIRCDARAGFVPVSGQEAVKWNEGQPVMYCWMRYVP